MQADGQSSVPNAEANEPVDNGGETAPTSNAEQPNEQQSPPMAEMPPPQNGEFDENASNSGSDVEQPAAEGGQQLNEEQLMHLDAWMNRPDSRRPPPPHTGWPAYWKFVKEKGLPIARQPSRTCRARRGGASPMDEID